MLLDEDEAGAELRETEDELLSTRGVLWREDEAALPELLPVLFAGTVAVCVPRCSR